MKFSSLYIYMINIYTYETGAINQLTKNLACEWAKDNIRVNSVAPWIIQTPLIDQIQVT